MANTGSAKQDLPAEPKLSNEFGEIQDFEAEPNKSLIRAFVRKCDWHLIPFLSLTYFFNSLDRSNLGNAQTAGFSTDIGLVGNQYNLILTFYYVPFVCFAPFFTMLTNAITARYSLSIMMCGFGLASLSTAFVKSFSGAFACRFFVGVFESGFLPSAIIYMSTFYTRRDIASRVGLFYAASVAAAAFGGLLSFAVFRIQDSTLHNWSYLFVIEGSLTMSIGLSLPWVIPGSLKSARWLSPEVKAAGAARLLRESLDKTEYKINWAEALRVLSTWHYYVRGLIAFSFGVLLSSNANFLAIITARLGFDTVKTNLYTVAPALTAAVVLILVCFSSDYFQERGVHMTSILSLSVVGYILLLTIDVAAQRGVAYFAIFLCTIGAYPMSVIFSTWLAVNLTNMNARAFTLGTLIPIANAAGLLSSNIFFAWEAPRYTFALICNCVAAGVCMVLSLSHSMWMRYDNRRRDAAQGTIPGGFTTEGITDERDPRFRWIP
ncbi:retrograde regulation protein 2 [Thozetella sp. PMI_491]|nr:retrograde regulation protein 2 [Thozetella sp. PMI_491]